MTDNKTWAIFHSPLYIGEMENHEQIQNDFKPIISDNVNFDKVSDWDSEVLSSFNVYKNDSFPWKLFRDEVILKHLASFLDSFAKNLNKDIQVDMIEYWVNKYKQNHFQEIHNHIAPDCHFSCVYMLHTPKNSGYIKFRHSQQDFWKQSGLRDIFDNLPSKIFCPVQHEGTILLFPSYLEHYVTPNLSQETRVTISANFSVSSERKI